MHTEASRHTSAVAAHRLRWWLDASGYLLARLTVNLSIRFPPRNITAKPIGRAGFSELNLPPWQMMPAAFGNLPYTSNSIVTAAVFQPLAVEKRMRVELNGELLDLPRVEHVKEPLAKRYRT